MTANEKTKTVRCPRCKTPMSRGIYGYMCERCLRIGWWEWVSRPTTEGNGHE